MKKELLIVVLFVALLFVLIPQNVVMASDIDNSKYQSGDLEFTIDNYEDLTKYEREAIKYLFAGIVDEPEIEYLSEGENSLCKLEGHLPKTVYISAIRHKAYDDDPRCEEIKYRVEICSRQGCGHYIEDVIFVNRISCHSQITADQEKINDLLTDNSNAKIGTTSEQVTENPQTSDDIIIYIFILPIATAISVLGLNVLRKRYRIM